MKCGRSGSRQTFDGQNLSPGGESLTSSATGHSFLPLAGELPVERKRDLARFAPGAHASGSVRGRMCVSRLDSWHAPSLGIAIHPWELC